MPEDKHHQVLSLGDGRWVVVTTSVRVRVVNAKQLKEMGLTPPALEVPWPEEAQRVVPAEERAAALAYWKLRLEGYDDRLKDRIVAFLREFGLEGVKQAIDQVAAKFPKANAEQKYTQLVREMGQMRERMAGGVG